MKCLDTDIHINLFFFGHIYCVAFLEMGTTSALINGLKGCLVTPWLLLVSLLKCCSGPFCSSAALWLTAVTSVPLKTIVHWGSRASNELQPFIPPIYFYFSSSDRYSLSENASLCEDYKSSSTAILTLHLIKLQFAAMENLNPLKLITLWTTPSHAKIKNPTPKAIQSFLTCC